MALTDSKLRNIKSLGSSKDVLMSKKSNSYALTVEALDMPKIEAKPEER